MKCVCIFEPRGCNGLEGYSKGDTYRFEDCGDYFRVWPVDDELNYYETCGPTVFRSYFKPIKAE